MNKLWANHRFVALSSAQLLSNFGLWLMYLAVMVLIGVRWHDGPWAVSLGLVALVAPGILVHPWAGALADRWDRKRLMVGSNVISGMTALTLLLVRDLWQLCLVLAMLGLIDTVFSPAESGMIKEVVPDGEMAQAMSIRMMISQGTKIVGPALSGALVVWMGARAPFAIDGILFLVSAGIVAFVPGGRAHLLEVAQARSKPRYLDGFRYLKRRPSLGVLALFFTMVMVVLQMVDSQVVILLRPLPQASRLLGLTMSCSGVGMGLAAFLLQKLRTQRTLSWMALGAAAMGIGFGAMTTLVWLRVGWALPMVVLGVGGAASLVMLPFQTALQQQTPSDWTGRVQAAVGTASSASSLAGPLVGAAFIAGVGVIPAFFAVSALLVVVGVAGGVISLSLRGARDAQGVRGIQDGASGTVDLGG